MSQYILPLIIGVAIGFFASKVIRIIRLKDYHKDVVEELIRGMETENTYAKELGARSFIDRTIEDRGIDYAIYHYGKIYRILSGVKGKNEKESNVENALRVFLQEALKYDIEEYKKMSAKNQKA